MAHGDWADERFLRSAPPLARRCRGGTRGAKPIADISLRREVIPFFDRKSSHPQRRVLIQFLAAYDVLSYGNWNRRPVTFHGKLDRRHAGQDWHIVPPQPQIQSKARALHARRCDRAGRRHRTCVVSINPQQARTILKNLGEGSVDKNPHCDRRKRTRVILYTGGAQRLSDACARAR
jgi:hypothetical protein